MRNIWAACLPVYRFCQVRATTRRLRSAPKHGRNWRWNSDAIIEAEWQPCCARDLSAKATLLNHLHDAWLFWRATNVDVVVGVAGLLWSVQSGCNWRCRSCRLLGPSFRIVSHRTLLLRRHTNCKLTWRPPTTALQNLLFRARWVYWCKLS